MNLVTYQNTRAPAGLRVVVLILVDGLDNPLPTPFLGDDLEEVRARAAAFGVKVEAFQAKQRELAKVVAAKALEKRKAGK